MSETIVIAGGGTGGHLVPAMALADAAGAAGDRPVLVTGDRPIEDRVLEGCPWPRRKLAARGFSTVGIGGRMLALLALPGAVWRAFRWLGELRPARVILTGGYVALPVGIAAALRRVPVALIEPNAIPGRTTRLLARLAGTLIVLDGSISLPGRAPRIVGMPVRSSIVAVGRLATRGESGRLLVLGGSQGARSLNLGVAVALADGDPVAVLHVSGPGRAGEARDAYASVGISAEVVEYLDDIAGALAAADLVVARAGAGTIAELIAAARPAVLVPYPHAADNHQEANARLFARLGGGLVVGEGDGFSARLGAAIKALRGPLGDDARLRLRESGIETDAGCLLARIKGTSV